jgi:hypothetical protein
VEIADFHGHRLSVRRVTPAGLYRAYLDGRIIGYWRNKDTALWRRPNGLRSRPNRERCAKESGNSKSGQSQRRRNNDPPAFGTRDRAGAADARDGEGSAKMIKASVKRRIRRKEGRDWRVSRMRSLFLFIAAVAWLIWQ